MSGVERCLSWAEMGDHDEHVACLHLFCIFLCPRCDDGERYRVDGRPRCSCY